MNLILFLTIYLKNAVKFIDLLSRALADGPKEFNQLCQILDYQKSGSFSGYLEDLLQSGFISRDFTWSLKSGKESRLSHFRLSDNYLRFYLKFILPHKPKIQQDRF